MRARIAIHAATKESTRTAELYVDGKYLARAAGDEDVQQLRDIADALNRDHQRGHP